MEKGTIFLGGLIIGHKNYYNNKTKSTQGNLYDLHNATLKLAKSRLPSPNSVSIEVFFAFWDLVGSIIHVALIHRTHLGYFHVLIIRSDIMFIPPKGNQCLLNNTWPITILNIICKI